MVTFVCSHCDATLKKKQCEKHFSCRPTSFICIDCHVTFNGGDFKNHISCLTEQEKHWG
jgi:cell growth-regulating nucleolar protein